MRGTGAEMVFGMGGMLSIPLERAAGDPDAIGLAAATGQKENPVLLTAGGLFIRPEAEGAPFARGKGIERGKHMRTGDTPVDGPRAGAASVNRTLVVIFDSHDMTGGGGGGAFDDDRIAVDDSGVEVTGAHL